MSPIHCNTYDIAMQSANNSFCAAYYIKDYNVIYCSNTFPGHHASTSCVAGYCLLNNASICAANLLQNGYKVDILDIDYHTAGNGTGEIFYYRTDVLNISIHADPMFEYNSCDGFEDEHGKFGLTHNIIFPKLAGYEEYKVCLDKALNLITSYNPDVLVLAFGGDTFKDDPDASILYDCQLIMENYCLIGQEIRKVCKKIIVTSEGGYEIEHMPNITLNLLNGLAH